MINIISKSYLLLFVLLTNICIAKAGIGKFYNEENRYRGFFWFEKTESKKQDQNHLQFQMPTPENALNSIENRKKALDDARNLMVELGFREDVPPQILRQAIVKYKKLEAKMFDGAIRLVHASEMANFTNPEIANANDIPTNVFANKIKRSVDERVKINKIYEFAHNYDLVLFSNDKCPYCQAFAPVITNFANEYKFSLDITNLESNAGKIAQKLGITAVPTLVAISKNSKQLFEISRGYSSLSELEANIVLANNLSEEKKFEAK